MASNGKWPNRQPNGENTTICLKRIPISLTDCEIKKLTDPYGQVDSITWLKHNLHSRFTMAFIVYSTSRYLIITIQKTLFICTDFRLIHYFL